MKYLVGVLLLLLVNAANAIHCRVDGGAWQNMDDGIMDVYTAVRATPGNGRIELDGYRIECKYPPGTGGGAQDKYFLWTKQDALIPGPKLFGHQMGLRVEGGHLDSPIPENIHVATMPGDGRIMTLNTYMYVNTTRVPGKYIDIRVGDRLGILALKRTNNIQLPWDSVSFWIHANNNFYFQPSTCTINDNNPIDIDFGQVDAATLSASPGSTPVRRTVMLSYSCPDYGIYTPITITVKGSSSSFSSTALSMSNNDLGTAVLRNGSVVAPESFYLTDINNSQGGDEVTFALVRRPGSLPAAGPFSGSATLIMGVP